MNIQDIQMLDKIEDYHKDQLTIDLVKANIFAIVLMLPIVLIFVLPYFLIWGIGFNSSDIRSLTKVLSPELMGLVLILVFTLGIILHELIHGIVWSRYTSNGFKSIRFGVLWKMLTPYCHCKEPLKVKEYIIGALMPAIILGFVPGILAIIIGNFGLLIFGIIFTTAASGDFMIINLLKNEDKDDYVQDHPSEAGCFIYRRKIEE
jgi:hypothetical protein